MEVAVETLITSRPTLHAAVLVREDQATNKGKQSTDKIIKIKHDELVCIVLP